MLSLYCIVVYHIILSVLKFVMQMFAISALTLLVGKGTELVFCKDFCRNIWQTTEYLMQTCIYVC